VRGVPPASGSRGQREVRPGLSDRLLTLAEAAEHLGCSPTTLKRRIAAGELAVFRDGRLVRVRQPDLDRYVAERVARSAPAAAA
jgi:excisionase family DNA binding protein